MIFNVASNIIFFSKGRDDKKKIYFDDLVWTLIWIRDNSYLSFEAPGLFQAVCPEFYVVTSLASLHIAFSVSAVFSGYFLVHQSAFAWLQFHK